MILTSRFRCPSLGYATTGSILYGAGEGTTPECAYAISASSCSSRWAYMLSTMATLGEAVSSCAAGLERFYEFYVAVAAEASNVGPEELALAWKAVSRQSERQLGMFVAAHLILTGSAPELLNPNSHVRFRNSVVHQGYVPEHHEAEEFCEVVLGMLDRLIDDLRGRCAIPLNAVYERFLPPELEEVPKLDGEEEVVGSTNILTVVNVLHPREHDGRAGGLSDQLKRIAKGQQTRMRVFSKEQLNLDYS